MISKTFVAGVAVGMLIVAAVATTTFQVGPSSRRALQQEMPSQMNPLIGKQDAQSARGNEGASRGNWRGGEGARRELSGVSSLAILPQNIATFLSDIPSLTQLTNLILHTNVLHANAIQIGLALFHHGQAH